MNKPLSSRKTILATVVLVVSFFLALKASRAEQVSDVASSENSAGRHVVQNDYGYWAFVNAGYPGVLYSADGISWGNGVTEGTISHIFDSADEPNMLGNVAVHYVKKSSEVFVVASPNYIPSQVGADSG